MHYDMSPLRLGILASGTGSNFAAIAQAISDKNLNAQIKTLIYNNPNAGVARKAEQWKIPAVLLNHHQFGRREDLDHAIMETMTAYQVDWVIMAGWMRCVTSVLLDAFPQRVLNIHPSLLPSFPGLHAVKQALAAGVTITGCTVHHVVPAVDSGPIVMQAAVPIMPNDTEATLHERIHVQEHIIYPRAIMLAATALSRN
ncbi:MAG: phosphoribosylglycinamide formyltransferase [Cyanothece sp. SIO2G6]|nr:phosphoribosylglycinamide formyltransferase [Cyanothece sp. SIO2G6]